MTKERLKIIFDGNELSRNEKEAELQSIIVATPATGGGGGGNGGGGNNGSKKSNR